ncbi:fimbrillin family protein [Phocaeicola sp.]
MMYKNALLMLCCGMACITACQNAGTEEPGSDDLYMSVVARIGEASNVPGERYVGPNVNNVEFTPGDDMGLFIDDAVAVRWVYSNGWLSENTTYWADKDRDHTFWAYYPYADAASSANVPMPSLLGQSGNIESISKCDFLVAKTTQTYGQDGVVLFKGEGKSFRHVSSLVHLVINGRENLANSILTKIAIAGKDITVSSSYSFTDNKVTLDRSEEGSLLEVPMEYEMNGQDQDFYFILNEKKTDDVMTLTIDYSTGDKNYTAKLEKFANNTLVGGAQQSYTLTIKDSSVIISDSEITSWDTGETMEDIIIGVEESK